MHPLAEKVKAAPDDRPFEDIRVLEWDIEVRIRGMSGRARDAIEGYCAAGPKGKRNYRDFRARVVVACAFDPEGVNLFDDADISWLSDRSALVLDKLFIPACRLSGLLDSDVEELAGNSEGDPTANSCSTSH